MHCLSVLPGRQPHCHANATSHSLLLRDDHIALDNHVPVQCLCLWLARHCAVIPVATQMPLPLVCLATVETCPIVCFWMMFRAGCCAQEGPRNRAPAGHKPSCNCETAREAAQGNGCRHGCPPRRSLKKRPPLILAFFLVVSFFCSCVWIFLVFLKIFLCFPRTLGSCEDLTCFSQHFSSIFPDFAWICLALLSICPLCFFKTQQRKEKSGWRGFLSMGCPFWGDGAQTPCLALRKGVGKREHISRKPACRKLVFSVTSISKKVPRAHQQNKARTIKTGPKD